MFKLLTLPFRILSLLVSLASLALLIAVLYFTYTWSQVVLESGLMGQTPAVSSCMVNKAWGELSSDAQKYVQEGNLGQLSSEDLSKISTHLQECLS